MLSITILFYIYLRIKYEILLFVYFKTLDQFSPSSFKIWI